MKAALLLPLALAGCDLSMTRQQKHTAQSAPTLWSGGPPVRLAPAGTIAADDSARAAAAATPPPLTLALVERGRERYTIFCAPCHGAGGAGDGIIVGRGYPRPPALYDPRAPARSPAQVVDVIAHGYGIMYDFAERVEPRDRWAIAAYVEALKRAHADAGAGR